MRRGRVHDADANRHSVPPESRRPAAPSHPTGSWARGHAHPSKRTALRATAEFRVSIGWTIPPPPRKVKRCSGSPLVGGEAAKVERRPRGVSLAPWPLRAAPHPVADCRSQCAYWAAVPGPDRRGQADPAPHDVLNMAHSVSWGAQLVVFGNIPQDEQLRPAAWPVGRNSYRVGNGLRMLTDSCRKILKTYVLGPACNSYLGVPSTTAATDLPPSAELVETIKDR